MPNFEYLQNVIPFATSNFLSRITFWWYTGLIWTGYKRPLTNRDLWRLDRYSSCKYILKRMERKIDGLQTERIIHQLQSGSMESETTPLVDSPPKAKKSISVMDSKPIAINVASLVLRIYWKQILTIVLLKLVTSVLTFANPLLLDKLLTFMRTSEEPLWRGVLYASLMFLIPMTESIINNQYEYWINTITLRVKTCLYSLIYTKVSSNKFQ